MYFRMLFGWVTTGIQNFIGTPWRCRYSTCPWSAFHAAPLSRCVQYTHRLPKTRDGNGYIPKSSDISYSHPPNKSLPNKIPIFVTSKRSYPYFVHRWVNNTRCVTRTYLILQGFGTAMKSINTCNMVVLVAMRNNCAHFIVVRRDYIYLSCNRLLHPLGLWCYINTILQCI